MLTVQLEDDPSIIIQDSDVGADAQWIVRVGQDTETFENWHAAWEYFLDEIKFWLGYYQTQKEEAEERGLTWTVDQYSVFSDDYERWIEYLQSVEDSPRGINFIGSNRSLSISARNNDAE